MIETASFAARTSSAIFGNLRQSSQNVRKRSSSLWNNFEKSSEIFINWLEVSENIPGGRFVWEKTVPEVLSTARGRRPKPVLKTKGTVFSHTDRLSPVNNMLIFFPAVNWLYRLQMRLFARLLSFNGLARRLPTICKKIFATNE